MCFLGIVRNGRVELPADANLPEGTQVRIEVTEETDPLDHLEELAGDFGPPDLATRHDWYLYGIDKPSA